MVNNGADINELMVNRRTPFLLALSRMMDANKLEYGLLDHMKQLGSDLNIKDSSKITPLIEVCRYYIDCNMIRYLIHNGADINAQDKRCVWKKCYPIFSNMMDGLE